MTGEGPEWRHVFVVPKKVKKFPWTEEGGGVPEDLTRRESNLMGRTYVLYVYVHTCIYGHTYECKCVRGCVCIPRSLKSSLS